MHSTPSDYLRMIQAGESQFEFGYMKDIGEGVERMIAEMKRFGLPEPEFSEPDDTFTVILKNSSHVTHNKLSLQEDVHENPNRTASG